MAEILFELARSGRGPGAPASRPLGRLQPAEPLATRRYFPGPGSMNPGSFAASSWPPPTRRPRRSYSELFGGSSNDFPLGPTDLSTTFKIDGRDLGAAL